ncbi:MAG: isochorismatase family protein, partial [Pseudomonadota bacterium]
MSKLVREHTAVVLIDHQRMLMSLLPEERRVQLRHHMKILLKIARAFDLPIIATSNLEDGANGPIAEVIQDHAPEAFEARIKRQGEFNAFENHEFGAAVAATGRRTLLIA